MAFPTVQTADTKNGTQTSNASNWTLTYPTNLASGDLLVLLAAVDGSVGSITLPGGWVTKGSTSSAVSRVLACKISGGTESGTFTFGVGASEQGGWRVFRITGWYGGSLGTADSDDADGLTSGFLQGAGGAGTDASAEVPSAAATWGSADTLWIGQCAVDASRTISGYPFADLQTADVSGGSTGATLGVCMKNSTQSSEAGGGAFSLSASDDWLTDTIAIRPAGATGNTYTKAGYGKESG